MAWLAQREHSRSELRQKLLRLAQQRAERAEPDTPAIDAAAGIDSLLDALQAQGLLSDQRFAESRLRVRADGQGLRRIQAELARHGVKLAPPSLQLLRDSELQRATQLWQRRFGRPAGDAKEHARQLRFLAGRGFAGDVIRQLLGPPPAPADPEPAEGPA